MTRIVIVGGPRTGKTTLASMSRLPVRHTDDVIDLGWSEASAEVATWFDALGPWCIEGVATARALRKWLSAHPHSKPCDEIWTLWRPHVALTDGQQRMAQGVATVWREVETSLRSRGCEVIDGGRNLTTELRKSTRSTGCVDSGGVKLEQLKKALPVLSRHAFEFSTGELRANGQPLTEESRKELLAKAVAREDVSLDLEVMAFEQRQGVANRNFVRFRDGAVIALGNSGTGKPFLADHNKWSLDARLGTILTSVGKRLDEGHYEIRMTVRLTDPAAVEKALRGLMSTVSIGWTPTGPIECSVHGTEIWTECYCWPGTRLAEVTDATGKKKYVRDRKGAAIVEWVYTAAELTECSAVNVPAVPGAHIERVRAALSEAGVSDDDAAQLIDLDHDKSTRPTHKPEAVSMTKDEVLAAYRELNDADRAAIDNTLAADRTAALAADPVEVTLSDGTEIRRSAGPQAVAMAKLALAAEKREKEQADKAASVQAAADRAALAARAKEQLAGMHGSDEVHVAILGAIEGIAEPMRAACLQSLKAWKAGGVAQAAPGVNPENGPAKSDAKTALNAALADFAKANNKSVAEATAAFLATKEGAALYVAAYPHTKA